MSDAVKPQMHGRDHRPGGADPIPEGTMDYFQAVASDSLGTSLTQLNFTDISAFVGGTNVSVDGNSDINILAAGVYLFRIYTSGWSLTSGVTSSVRGTVNVSSGGGGNWDGRFGSDEMYWEIPLRLNDADDTIDFSPTSSPDASAIAAWATTATFPVVLQFKLLKLEDNVGTAATTPSVRVSVTRLGTGFE